MPHGMRHALFTGRKLSGYINDWGTDKAGLIASYAVTPEGVIRQAITD
jgi:hypothetical protein